MVKFRETIVCYQYDREGMADGFIHNGLFAFSYTCRYENGSLLSSLKTSLSLKMEQSSIPSVADYR